MKKYLFLSILFVNCCTFISGPTPTPPADSAQLVIAVTTADAPINPYLWGFDDATFRDYSPDDTAALRKIDSISPNIICYPTNGVEANWALNSGTRGYGFDSSSILAMTKQLKVTTTCGSLQCLEEMPGNSYQKRNYQSMFTDLSGKLNCPSIYYANVITQSGQDAVNFIKLHHPKVVVLGVELFLPNAAPVFPTVSAYMADARPIALAIAKYDTSVKIAVQIPSYVPNDRDPQNLTQETWFDSLSKQKWFSMIAVYQWNTGASSLSSTEPTDSLFAQEMRYDNQFFDSLGSQLAFYHNLGDKFLVQQAGVDDSKTGNTSIFGGTMVQALHTARYFMWLLNQDKIYAVTYGGSLISAYPPTTIYTAVHTPPSNINAALSTTITSKISYLLSAAFHGATLNSVSIGTVANVYCASVTSGKSTIIYIVNYGSTALTRTIKVNGASPVRVSAEEYWGTPQSTYSTAHHTISTSNSIVIEPYSVTKVICD